MNYESAALALAQLEKLGKTYMAYTHALGVMEQDAATAAPAGSWEGRGVTTGILSEVMYDLIADPRNGELIAFLREHAGELNEIQLRELEILDKKYQQMNCIPAEEYVAFNILRNDAQVAWEKAKNASDFSIFQPYLERIVEFQKKGSRLALSDAGCAAVCCKAAMESAKLNVYINLKLMKDEEKVRQYQNRMDEAFIRGMALADQVYREVEEELRP